MYVKCMINMSKHLIVPRTLLKHYSLVYIVNLVYFPLFHSPLLIKLSIHITGQIALILSGIFEAENMSYNTNALRLLIVELSYVCRCL